MFQDCSQALSPTVVSSKGFDINKVKPAFGCQSFVPGAQLTRVGALRQAAMARSQGMYKQGRNHDRVGRGPKGR